MRFTNNEIRAALHIGDVIHVAWFHNGTPYDRKLRFVIVTPFKIFKIFSIIDEQYREWLVSAKKQLIGK